jgi:hypothetical protein
MQPAHIQEAPISNIGRDWGLTGDDDGGSAHLWNVSQL